MPYDMKRELISHARQRSPRSLQRAEQSGIQKRPPERDPVQLYHDAMLGDKLLNRQGNALVRVAVLRQAQQTYGNRAVQRFLQRQCVDNVRVQRDPDTAAQANASNDDVTISFGSKAKQSAVSDYSLGVLKDVLRAAGLKSATITSTARSAEDQARAMYNNLVGTGKGQGVDAQYDLYGPAGDKVIDVYVALKEQKKSASEIKAAMKDKILETGPSKVSRHCGDPDKLNVFDVGPNSIGDADAQKAFKKAANAEVGKRVSNFIPYPKDPGHHFEIVPK